MSKTFYVTCPCCEGLLEVNQANGKVVQSWSKEDRPQDGEDKMAAALKKIEEDKKKRQDLFSVKKQELSDQKKKLEDAFRKEVKKAKKEGVEDKPFRPFDLD